MPTSIQKLSSVLAGVLLGASFAITAASADKDKDKPAAADKSATADKAAGDKSGDALEPGPGGHFKVEAKSTEGSVTIGGRKIDLYTAKAHRRHHKAPSVIDQTLLHPSEILGSMFLIAITSAPLIALLVALPTGGDLLAVYLSSLLWNYVGLYRYEWSHFLIHTPYIPKTRFFRSIWRSHRLHHFKHEDYWMGVTSNFGDRMLKTFPEQKTIKKSPTARNLGVETETYDEPAARA